MVRQLTPLILLILAISSCGAEVADPDGDLGQQTQCDCDQDTEACMIEYGEGGPWEDLPWSCAAVPPDCPGEPSYLDCVGRDLCGGRPWIWVAKGDEYRRAVFCLPAGYRPCPVFDGGVRWLFDLCAEDQVCINLPTSGECYAECRTIPAECLSNPTCECVGPDLCGEEGRFCQDDPGCSRGVLTCNAPGNK